MEEEEEEADGREPSEYRRPGKEVEIAMKRLLDGDIEMEEYKRIVDMYKFKVE